MILRIIENRRSILNLQKICRKSKRRSAKFLQFFELLDFNFSFISAKACPNPPEVLNLDTSEKTKVKISWSGTSLSSEKFEISYCPMENAEQVVVENLEKSERSVILKNLVNDKWLVAIRASNSLGFGNAKFITFEI